MRDSRSLNPARHRHRSLGGALLVSQSESYSLAMTTGRAAAEAALREPMRAVGWQPKATGWFTTHVTTGFLGVIAIGSASRHANPGTAWITLYVGVRDESTELVVSEMCGRVDQGYRQRTAISGIGCLLPRKSWHEWHITLDNAADRAGEIAALVPRYAEPYLQQLSSDHTALLAAVRQSPGYSQAEGACRVAVLLDRYQGHNEALDFLNRRTTALSTRTDIAADQEREAITRTREWITAT
jgi:hypothetical protein